MSEILSKTDRKVLDNYIMGKVAGIANARMKVIEAGGRPNTVYIGDILPRDMDELRPPIKKLDTGITVFGMKVILDHRIPHGETYIVQGEL